MRAPVQGDGEPLVQTVTFELLTRDGQPGVAAREITDDDLG